MQNSELLRLKAGFTDPAIARMRRDPVEMC
jgi:hypothetical protein